MSFWNQLGSGNESGLTISFSDSFTHALRYILPAIALLIVLRCALSLLTDKNEKEIWGYLSVPNGKRIPLYHWENTVGRSELCDVVVNSPTVSRTHAALIRDDKGNWRIIDIASRGGVKAGGEKVHISSMIHNGTVITLADTELVFLALTSEQEKQLAAKRSKAGRHFRPWFTFVLLSVFQVLLAIQFCVSGSESFTAMIPVAFLGLGILMWFYFLFIRSFGRTGFEVESLAFLLTTVGLAVTSTSAPESLLKQLACICAGIVGFTVLGWYLRDLRRTKFMRWAAGAFGLVLLAFNVLTAETIYGAKNWLSIGGISFQPSEFVKICYVFAGAATLDRLYIRRNLLFFIAFAGASVMALVLMSDFGTAVVFFSAYLVIAFLRSGNMATIFLSVGGSVLAGVMALTMKPYIASRFETWGHAWSDPYDGGFQQVRAMTATASGGLFGVGAGKGWFHTVFAADTDMVFALVAEELGLILALLAVISILILTFFAVRASANSRSSFYIISACASVTIMMAQVILNVFGSLDLLPFTGVTFPFVSTGGSSMMTCWILLAFIKAVDTRRNASIAVRQPKLAQN